MLKQYKLRFYNFRLIIFLLAISLIGVTLVGTAASYSCSLQLSNSFSSKIFFIFHPFNTIVSTIFSSFGKGVEPDFL